MTFKLTFAHAYQKQTTLPPPEQKKLIGKSSILARGKSCVLPTDPFFTREIDYVPMHHYPIDR